MPFLFSCVLYDYANWLSRMPIKTAKLHRIFLSNQLNYLLSANFLIFFALESLRFSGNLCVWSWLHSLFSHFLHIFFAITLSFWCASKRNALGFLYGMVGRLSNRLLDALGTVQKMKYPKLQHACYPVLLNEIAWFDSQWTIAIDFTTKTSQHQVCTRNGHDVEKAVLGSGANNARKRQK